MKLDIVKIRDLAVIFIVCVFNLDILFALLGRGEMPPWHVLYFGGVATIGTLSYWVSKRARKDFSDQMRVDSVPDFDADAVSGCTMLDFYNWRQANPGKIDTLYLHNYLANGKIEDIRVSPFDGGWSNHTSSAVKDTVAYAVIDGEFKPVLHMDDYHGFEAESRSVVLGLRKFFGLGTPVQTTNAEGLTETQRRTLIYQYGGR